MPLTPVVYLLLLLFVGVQYQRAKRMERAIFGLKVSSFWGQWGKSILYGLIIGILVSAGLDLLGRIWLLYVPTALIVEVWAVSLILAMVDVRWADIAFVAPLVIVIAEVLQDFFSLQSVWMPSLAALRSLLLITGVAQALAGIAFMIDAGRNPSPLYVSSKRGQVVGMFVNQSFWPIPLLVPGAGFFLPLAVLAGSSGDSIATQPYRIMRKKGFIMLAVGLLTVAGCVNLWGSAWGIFATASIGLILRVAGSLVVQWLERGGVPLYVRPNRGVRVLATIAASPAACLGIRFGEIIRKVGSTSVDSPYDVHFAIDQNPAYVKLEVVDTVGEARLIGTPIFADGPSQLGIVVVPDDHLHQYRVVYGLGQWVWIWRWWGRRSKAIAKGIPIPLAAHSEEQPL